MGSRRAKNFTYKLWRFEFWPWWALFVPLVPMYCYSVLRTGRLLYFTAVNPSIDMGGFFGEKKDEIMELIPPKFKPKEQVFKVGDEILLSQDISYPCFVKPNVGERGYEVREIRNESELLEYAAKGFDFMVQQKLNEEVELGVLFHRNTPEGGAVSSIALKDFMKVIGDGKHTVKELVEQNKRHAMYIDVLLNRQLEVLNRIPDDGEVVEVHKIGNHCKGTRFINANHMISEKLNEVFRSLSDEIKGFDYGRFDLKTASFEELEKGNFKIFELNGISSEPGHIYGYPHVFKAYGSLYTHWNHIMALSRVNIKKGVKTTPLSKFIKQVKYHFFT